MLIAEWAEWRKFHLRTVARLRREGGKEVNARQSSSDRPMKEGKKEGPSSCISLNVNGICEMLTDRGLERGSKDDHEEIILIMKPDLNGPENCCTVCV